MAGKKSPFFLINGENTAGKPSIAAAKESMQTMLNAIGLLISRML
jgi:hypothetical protein